MKCENGGTCFGAIDAICCCPEGSTIFICYIYNSQYIYFGIIHIQFAGYTGLRCEMYSGDCPENFCSFGGVCFQADGENHCQCPNGFVLSELDWQALGLNLTGYFSVISMDKAREIKLNVVLFNPQLFRFSGETCSLFEGPVLCEDKLCDNRVCASDGTCSCPPSIPESLSVLIEEEPCPPNFYGLSCLVHHLNYFLQKHLFI